LKEKKRKGEGFQLRGPYYLDNNLFGTEGKKRGGGKEKGKGNFTLPFPNERGGNIYILLRGEGKRGRKSFVFLGKKGGKEGGRK